MKRFFIPVLIAFCAVFTFSSCEPQDPYKDFSGTPYGFWIVDKLDVEVSTTINGNTTKHTSTTDFSKYYCRLNLDNVSHLAALWYNLDFDLEAFSYDEGTGRLTFKESLNAGDNGKAIILLGIYNVELSGNEMVLSQPEASIGGSSLGASERATYYLHRAPKDEKPKETPSSGD